MYVSVCTHVRGYIATDEANSNSTKGLVKKYRGGGKHLEMWMIKNT